MSDGSNGKTLRQAGQWIVASWKAVVGVAGGLAIILGLIFHPPWDRGSSSNAANTKTTTKTCPGVSDGHVRKVTADQRIPLSAYWQLNPGARTAVSKQRLKALGQLVHFRVDINGYRGRQLTVWWWTLTANGAPVAEPTLQRQLAFALTPHDCTTGGTRELWAELPKHNGKYKIEIQLLDPSGEQLDYGRTKPFIVHHGTAT